MQATFSSGGKVLQRHLLVNQCKAATSASLIGSAASSSSIETRPQQHVQVRHLPWVPQAYRRTRSRTPPRSRPGKSSNSSAHAPNNSSNNKNHSSSSSSFRSRTPRRHRRSNRGVGVSGTGSSNRKSTAGVNHNHRGGSRQFRIQKEKDEFIDLKKDLEQRLQKYRQILGEQEEQHANNIQGSNKSGNDNDDSLPAGVSQQQIIPVLLSQLSDLHVNSTSESWNDVEKTEHDFRGICKIVSDMIFTSTKIQNLILWDIAESSQHEEPKESSEITYYCHLGEQLLQSLIDMQNDRRQYVESTPVSLDSDQSVSHSWFGWLKSKVANKVDEEPVHEDTTKTILAHDDPLCGPRLEHFHSVSNMMLKTLREEVKDKKQSPIRKIRRAQRLQQLVEKMPSNVEPDETCIKTLMSSYAFIGSYESASGCEKIYQKYPDMQHATFGILLHAYFLAARYSPRKVEGSKAAIRAEELVRQKWGRHDDGDGPDQYEESKFEHCAKALLCLHATGTEAIPDICSRADSLVDLCIGRNSFEQLFRSGTLEGLWKIAPASLTLPLLNCVVLIYASSGDPSRLNLAKKLLKILLEDPDFKANKDIPYPDVRTCKAVFNGLIHLNDRWNSRVAPSRGSKNGSPLQSGRARDNFDFGMELLDLMFARSPCWPDQSYFHSLFRCLIMARPKDAGSQADDILARMHARQCFEKTDYSVLARKSYHYALRCWVASAESGDPEAARRALQLLEMMEAQSLPLFTSQANTRDSDGFSVYNTVVVPDRGTYHLVLKVCSVIKAHSEKENALEIALDVEKKMKKREILPSSDTYALLFSCCANLLPEHSERRQRVTAQLLTDARNQGNVNETVLSQLKDAGEEKTPDSGDRRDQPSAGGLLADL